MSKDNANDEGDLPLSQVHADSIKRPGLFGDREPYFVKTVPYYPSEGSDESKTLSSFAEDVRDMYDGWTPGDPEDPSSGPG